MNIESKLALEKALKGTHKNVYTVCYELGIELPEDDNTEANLNVSACSQCDIWLTRTQMLTDVHGYNICPTCLDLETMRF